MEERYRHSSFERIWRLVALFVLCALVYYFSFENGRQTSRAKMDRLTADNDSLRLQLSLQSKEIDELKKNLRLTQAKIQDKSNLETDKNTNEEHLGQEKSNDSSNTYNNSTVTPPANTPPNTDNNGNYPEGSSTTLSSSSFSTPSSSSTIAPQAIEPKVNETLNSDTRANAQEMDDTDKNSKFKETENTHVSSSNIESTNLPPSSESKETNSSKATSSPSSSETKDITENNRDTESTSTERKGDNTVEDESNTLNPQKETQNIDSQSTPEVTKFQLRNEENKLILNNQALLSVVSIDSLDKTVLVRIHQLDIEKRESKTMEIGDSFIIKRGDKTIRLILDQLKGSLAVFLLITT
jgi:hypothetical protein